MTEPTQPERGTEQPSEELPIPTLETPSSVSSPSSVDTDAIVKKVADELRRELRMAQSTKDKEIATIKKTLGISDLSELEAMGATIPENVKLEHRLRQLESQRTAGNSPEQEVSSPGNGATLTAQDVSEVVKKFNLNANEPDVIGALRATYRNRDHFEAALAQLALAQVNRPNPSAAQSTTMAGSPPPGQRSASQLESDYQKELQDVMKNSRPGDGRIRALAELKAKYRAEGLNK